jgi:hypothetical protein
MPEPIVPPAPPAKKPVAKTKVIVEAVRRQGYPGFYCLGRLFPTDTPVEIEVTTEDIYKTRKVTDPVTEEVTEERFLFKESEMKQLVAHKTWLKIYEQGQTEVGGKKAVAHGSPEYLKLAAEEIDTADKESRTSGDKGPTGVKR